MASSQVEIVSSSPFGRVLRDQNTARRDQRCRESNARAAAFQKNIKDLVRDHFHNCISVSADENSQNQSKNIDSWTGNEQKSHHNHRNLRYLTKKQSKSNENHDGNDQSTVMNSTQCRIVDRWAAKQARETVSTIEKQSEEVAETELLGGAPSTSKTESSQKNPPPPDESENPPPETGNLGASSLVQIWEARLNRSNSMNNNNMNPVSVSVSVSVASRTSSGLSYCENVSSPRVETSRGSEISDGIEEKSDGGGGRANPENSFPDWETQSDRTAVSEPPTERNSDAVESERVRIADIIKRLRSGNDDNDNETGSNVWESPSRERRHAPFSEPVEQRGLTQLISSPKIRGRQAFADLLMQMERDRHKELDSLVERQSVSKFSQRGRIQSLLRLRFLQRGMAVREQERPQSAGSPSSRLSLGSSIMQLREKFGTGIENGVTAQTSAATSSRNSRTEMANMRANQDDTSTSNRLSENNRVQEVSVAEKLSTNCEGEGSTSTDGAKQGTNSENTLLGSQETAETTAPPLNVCDQEANNHQQNLETRAILDDQNENEMVYREQEASVLNDRNENEMACEEQEASDQRQLFLHPQETTETTAFVDNWYENELAEAEEEETYDDQYFLENNNDWISEISRPRSHWESIRQAWYQERLNSSTDNDEIRQLIERKRVSTFLSSEFRDTMDQLMTSRAVRQADIDSSISHPFHEVSEYFQSSSTLQMPSPSMITSWSYRDNEVGDESDPVASPSPQPLPSQTYYEDSRRSPDPANHLSLEMELIYNLRGQIEQLHREMSELRKSVQSCTDMQIKMQHSNQQEVHPVRVMANNPLVVGVPNKRSCCICYEMQVDSLLYRCGHMCTCLKCAHELQWSSGKCPICRAPIDDVVRAYMDA
ncbi:hypothetical protein JRO89_XS06G0258400 [Xanthoceras sorbifolium]|uniref:RING-type domain-containing protein n=1 Tax=Xanthoceras sorbifolium TaxID=99658 RepID=A0ABQ8HZW0_9ROSI|nr:hypothetical protein JRO89_XS06G0258400 [Xanthoceras sorbifolium]